MGEEALAEALGKLVSERFPDCEVTPASDGMAIEI
jgi:hypothetical protein